jgi:hypothetical protein
MVARARRPHASSRVATRARWDTPPLYDDDAFLFWETPRARALRERGVCRAFRPASRDPSIGYSASGARAGGDRKGTPSLPKPVARARVRDVHPDGCLPSGQSAKAFRFFSREIGARRAGRSVPFFNVFHGAPEARLSQIGSRAGRARQGRRGSSPRRGRRRHVARVSTRALPRVEDFPNREPRFGSRRAPPRDSIRSRRADNLRPVEICAIPLSTSPR